MSLLTTIEKLCVRVFTNHSAVGVSQQDSVSVQQGAMTTALSRLRQRDGDNNNNNNKKA